MEIRRLILVLALGATPELMGKVNTQYSLGLEQRMVERPQPGDDDGSFVLAGYPAAIINIGSWPYGDPNYHAPGDAPERCDILNAARVVQATVRADRLVILGEVHGEVQGATRIQICAGGKLFGDAVNFAAHANDLPAARANLVFALESYRRAVEIEIKIEFVALSPNVVKA